MRSIAVVGSGPAARALASRLGGTAVPAEPPGATWTVYPNGPAGASAKLVLEAMAQLRGRGEAGELTVAGVRVVYRPPPAPPPRARGKSVPMRPEDIPPEFRERKAPEPGPVAAALPEVHGPARIIQIDVTTACSRHCSNCTRFCGHGARFAASMTVDQFAAAVSSLEGYPGMVGMMGGEPTLHPDFEELCRIISAARPDPEPGPEAFTVHESWAEANRDALTYRPWRKGLWTSLGPGYRRNYELIRRTFRYQCVNTHQAGSRHLSLLMPRRELGVPDDVWFPLRDACWVPRLWSAAVTSRGAFFCEIAAGLSRLFDGPPGLEVKPGWWNLPREAFDYQRELCELCSACLPVPADVDSVEADRVTPGMRDRLRALGSSKQLIVETRTWAELSRAYRPNDRIEPYLAGPRAAGPTGLELGRVVGVTVSVGYDDYLAEVLPRAVEELGRVIVVTSPTDEATKRVACAAGADIFPTAELADGKLRKGAAIDAALSTLPEDTWVVHFDADILLPRGWGDRLRRLELNPGGLYFTERFGPPLDDVGAAAATARKAREADDWLPLRESFGERLYVQRQPWGYLQVFNLSASALRARGRRYPAESHSAGHDDSALSVQWYGPGRCSLLPPERFAVLHLPHGFSRTNWSGRTSPRIDDRFPWASKSEELWRTSWRSGRQFAGLWQLTRAVPLKPGAIVVELGTFLGDGAAVLAAAYPECRIITVDPGERPDLVELSAMRLAVWPNVELWTMTSAEAAARFTAEGLRAGLVYIDADHAFAGVSEDIGTWRKLLAPGGRLAGHDYVDLWPGVIQAVDCLLGRPCAIFCDWSWLAEVQGPPMGGGPESEA